MGKDDDFTDWLTRDSRSLSRHSGPPAISSLTIAETTTDTALSRCSLSPLLALEKLREKLGTDGHDADTRT
jgi:hypothetical protein